VKRIIAFFLGFFLGLFILFVGPSFVFFLRMIGRVKVIGREHLFPHDKGLFVFPNHLSMMEFVLPALYFPEFIVNPFRYFPRCAVERRYYPWLYLLRVIPIDRRHGIKNRNDTAIIKMQKVLKKRKAVILWPEGTRLAHNYGEIIRSPVKGKRMGRFKQGVLKVVDGSDCDIVLVWIEGVDKVLPVDGFFPSLKTCMTCSVVIKRNKKQY